MMGTWSRIAGRVFLDWIAPKPGLSWVDIGCGNGAFTESIIEHCAPREVHGIDPSEGQLAFARTRPGAHLAQFHQGDAMKLPFEDAAFDVATMALVLFFVPEPAQGVAEMARVLKPGGTAAAYAWDMFGVASRRSRCLSNCARWASIRRARRGRKRRGARSCKNCGRRRGSLTSRRA
jgi:ubiquinone/menaquinone biosynthesis C-methylase UbiE